MNHCTWYPHDTYSVKFLFSLTSCSFYNPHALEQCSLYRRSHCGVSHCYSKCQPEINWLVKQEKCNIYCEMLSIPSCYKSRIACSHLQTEDTVRTLAHILHKFDLQINHFHLTAQSTDFFVAYLALTFQKSSDITP
jgi:hypothetical protein